MDKNDYKYILGTRGSYKFPLHSKYSKDEYYLINYKKRHRYIYYIWNLTSKCGRSILRWAFISLLLISLFSIIYGLIGPSGFYMKNQTRISFIYFSVVTFSTLGFGDITPLKWYSEVLVIIEVLFGYVMLGGLISIFSNKLASRA